MIKVLRILGWMLAWLTLGAGALWSIGAVYYDFPWSSARTIAALVLAAGYAAALILLGSRWRKLGGMAIAFAIVLGWWLTLQPRNDRTWQPDVDRTAWAEIKGDEVILHHVRNCEYRTETDFTPRWETRSVRLSQLRGVDLAICYWGSPWMAHPIASFQFADGPPVCFSIETRKEMGESYAALAGIYRQFELIYVVADERDVLRLRTNYREGEEIFLYRTNVTPENARIFFLEYLEMVNRLHERPKWYNAITTNCTTSIRVQRAPERRAPWDWRLLVNGKADEMLYERGSIATGGLAFPELRVRSRINDVARQHGQAADFSEQVRKVLPAFQSGASR